MDEQDRPGGLTALAVINFIFAALSLLGILAIFFVRIFINSIPMDQMTEAQAAGLAALQNMSGSTLAVMTCISTITFLLLLLSGIGYLKQKRVLGRILGSIYGVLSIIHTILSTTIFSGVSGKSFGITSIIILIYSVLTLILLNTVYKDDLIY
jgi:hypothetical protein